MQARPFSTSKFLIKPEHQRAPWPVVDIRFPGSSTKVLVPPSSFSVENFQVVFLDLFLRSRSFFNRSSSFKYAALGTVKNLRTALSIRSASVLPGTSGGGKGFMLISS